MAAGGDSGETVADGSATVHIRCSNGSKFTIQTGLDATVVAFKAALAEKCDVPAEQQRLIYKGRILKDEQTLESYGVESDHTIHLVRGAVPASVNVGASGPPNSTPGVARVSGSNERGGHGGAGLGASLFPGLDVNGLGGTGAPGLFGSLPDFGQVQQQLTQNPNMVHDIMNTSVIQNLMSNPDLLRNLIMRNPQMREILDRNPELAHVLNDPNTLRQTLEAARNPELMREMMRNTDRAMSNIESSPEGFNMLRRMYETVQEPFLNAANTAGDAGGTLGSNPFAVLLGNQGSARPVDQSVNPSTIGSDVMNGSPAPNTNPLPNPWNNAAGTQTTNTRSTPVSDARIPRSVGLGVLGLPESGSMPDPSLMNQVLQNPAMLQMMQSLLSNPQYLNQVLNTNPNIRNLMESNTQVREMLQNPEFLRQMTSPEILQQLMSLNQTLLSQFGRQPEFQEQNQTGGGTGTPSNTGLEFLMNMFGGLGASVPTAPNTSNVPPEELYATQLSQLQEMGFFDTQENIRALSATAGNVHAAVERLLGNLGQ